MIQAPNVRTVAGLSGAWHIESSHRMGRTYCGKRGPWAIRNSWSDYESIGENVNRFFCRSCVRRYASDLKAVRQLRHERVYFQQTETG